MTSYFAVKHMLWPSGGTDDANSVFSGAESKLSGSFANRSPRIDHEISPDRKEKVSLDAYSPAPTDKNKH